MVQLLLMRDSGKGTAGGVGGRYSFILSIITSREEGVTFYISTSCIVVTVRDWNVVLSIKGL